MSGTSQFDYSELAKKYGGTVVPPNGAAPASPMPALASPAAATPPATPAASTAASTSQLDYNELAKKYGGTVVPANGSAAASTDTIATQANEIENRKNIPADHPVWEMYKNITSALNPTVNPVVAGGFLKEAGSKLASLINIANGLDDKLSPNPAARHPIHAEVHKETVEAAKWLREHTRKQGWTEGSPGNPMAGFQENLGAVGEEFAEWNLLKGIFKLAIPASRFGAMGPVTSAGKAAPKVNAVTDAFTNAVESMRDSATVGKLLANYPVLNNAVTIGLKTINQMAGLEPEFLQNAAVGATQGFVSSEGSGKGTAEGAAIGGAGGAFIESLVEEAAPFIKRLKAARAAEAETSGVVPPPKREPAVPPPPVKPEFTPTDVGPEPGKPTAPAPLVHPPAPEPPPPLEPPAPLPPTEVPPPPQEPAPLEPSPLPEKPQPLEDYSPNRAPIEQRIADMEKQLSQGVVGESSTAAAQQLEDLYDSLRDKNFTRLKPENQQRIMQLRRSLAQFITRGAPPPDSEEFINQAGDLATAAEMMRKPGAQARARWNDLSGGKYESLTRDLEKLEGKVDQESIAKRGDLEREMNRLVSDPKFMGSASPARRAIYKTMEQRADVVEEAGTVFDKSFKGAERTGDFDIKALQRNWKAYVQKHGAEQVKDALGAERFNSMNDFVNNVAAEPKIDAAYQALHDAQNAEMVKNWQQQVGEISEKDAAAQAAQKAQFKEATERWKEQERLAKEADAAAKKQQGAEFKAAKAERSAEYKKAKADYDAGVQAREAERRKLIADRKAEYERQVADYKQAKADAANKDAATQKQIDDAHNLRMASYKLESKRIKELNLLHDADYDLMLEKKAMAEKEKGGRVLSILKRIKFGNPIVDSAVLATGLALPELVLNLASHGLSFRGGAAAGAGLGVYLLKKALVNPTTGRLVAEALVNGGKANVYGPVIYDLIKSATAKEPEWKRTMVEEKPEGLAEPGNIDIRNRPVVQNADGSHSSELSFSMQDDDGKEVLVPAVVDGKFMTPDGKKPPMGRTIGGKYVPTPEEEAMQRRAWEHYKKTGEHLGKFNSAEAADAYAQKLHERDE